MSAISQSYSLSGSANTTFTFSHPVYDASLLSATLDGVSTPVSMVSAPGTGATSVDVSVPAAAGLTGVTLKLTLNTGEANQLSTFSNAAVTTPQALNNEVGALWQKINTVDDQALENTGSGYDAQDATIINVGAAVEATDALRADQAPSSIGKLAADASFNSHKATAVANATLATDAPNAGQAATSAGLNTADINLNLKKIVQLLAGAADTDAAALSQVLSTLGLNSGDLDANGKKITANDGTYTDVLATVAYVLSVVGGGGNLPPVTSKAKDVLRVNDAGNAAEWSNGVQISNAADRVTINKTTLEATVINAVVMAISSVLQSAGGLDITDTSGLISKFFDGLFAKFGVNGRVTLAATNTSLTIGINCDASLFNSTGTPQIDAGPAGRAPYDNTEAIAVWQFGIGAGSIHVIRQYVHPSGWSTSGAAITPMTLTVTLGNNGSPQNQIYDGSALQDIETKNITAANLNGTTGHDHTGVDGHGPKLGIAAGLKTDVISLVTVTPNAGPDTASASTTIASNEDNPIISVWVDQGSGAAKIIDYFYYWIEISGATWNWGVIYHYNANADGILTAEFKCRRLLS